VPTAVHDRTSPARSAEGPVLVRIAADDAAWVHSLPSLPEPLRVGMTVGDASLASHVEELEARGYDLIEVVPGRRPGRHADVLVTAALREEHPRWFAAMLLVAQRVFDLRFGPVQIALHDELVAHLPSPDVD
jgi:hypothetical protein